MTTTAADVKQWVDDTTVQLLAQSNTIGDLTQELHDSTSEVQNLQLEIQDLQQAMGRNAADFVVERDQPTPFNCGTGILRSRPTDILKPGIETFGSWDSKGRLNLHPGAEVRDLIIQGYVNGNTEDNLLENCEIPGDPKLPAAQDGLPLVQFGGARKRQNVIRFCEVHNIVHTSKNGIGGHQVWAERNVVHHCTDAFSPNGPVNNDFDFDIVANCEGLRIFFANDPAHDPTPQTNIAGLDVGPWGGKPWNHSDGMQLELATGFGVRTRGNSWSAVWARDSLSSQPLPLAPKELSCLMIKGHVESRGDWFEGGEIAINCAKTATGFVRDAKFKKSTIQHKGTKYYAFVNNGGAVQFTNATYDDGTPAVAAY